MNRQDTEKITATVRENLLTWQQEADTAQQLSTLQIKTLLREYFKKEDAQQDTVALRRLAEALLFTSDKDTPLFKNEWALAFLDALFEAHPDFWPDEQPQSEDTNGDLPITIAHFDSAPLREAAVRFQALIKSAKALPCGSFTAAVEEVSTGKAAFSILPIEDSTEGKLTRFYEQIDRFELHIAAALDMPARADGNQVRVALVDKGETSIATNGYAHVTECLLFEENKRSLTAVLDAAEALGLTLHRIDSLPISYRDDGFSKHLVFEGSGAACQRLHAYLALFMPRTSVTADYVLILND